MKRMIAGSTLVLMLSAAGAAAQDRPPAEEARLGPRVDELNDTLKKIVVLLEQQVRGQQTNQLMKRIELRRRSLEPLERELRGSRQALESMEADLKRVEAQQDYLDEEREKQLQAGVAADDSQLKMERRMVDLQLEELLARKETLEQRIFELENDLAGRQAELRDWEEILDEELGLR